MSNGSPALPVWIVPSEELLRNGGTIPVQGGAAVPFTFDGSLEPGQVPQWDGTGFVGVTPVTNALFSPFGNSITDASLLRLALPLGYTDLGLIVPSGYKGLHVSSRVTNPTGSGISWVANLDFGATRYILQTITANANSASSLSTGFILNAGDKYGVTPVAANLNVSAKLFLFPDEGALKLISVALSSGNNTIYTPPTGKKGYIVALKSGAAGVPFGIDLPETNIINNSGGARTYTGYIVPSGDSPGAANQVTATSISVADGGIGPVIHNSFIVPNGSSWVINSSGSGNQLFMAIVLEVDA